MSQVVDLAHPAGLDDSQQSTPLTPKSFFGSEQEHDSDIESCATTVPETVMAEQVANDVVKEAQSVGPAPIDDSASTTNTPAVTGELPAGTAITKANSSEASSSKAIANGTGAASDDTAHVSEQAEGQATAVSRDDKEHRSRTNSSRSRVSIPAHHSPSAMATPATIRRPTRKLWPTLAAAQTQTSAAPAALTSRSAMQTMCGRTPW